MGKRRTMAEIKAANSAIGNTWFDTSHAKKLGTSYARETLYEPLTDVTLFIEGIVSNGKRMYWVCASKPDGSIHIWGIASIGKNGLNDAKQVMRRMPGRVAREHEAWGNASQELRDSETWGTAVTLRQHVWKILSKREVK